MTPVEARLVLLEAAQRDPQVTEAWRVLRREAVEEGMSLAAEARGHAKAEEGAKGGRPRHPLWGRVEEIDATLPYTAKTHRARLIRKQLKDEGHPNVPSADTVERGLPTR